MARHVAIRYRDFWDVPRMFIVRHEEHWFLFDCPFDEGKEDFSDTYRVYLLPQIDEEWLAGFWASLSEKAIRRLKDVPVSQVKWDPTKRKGIDPSILDGVSPAKCEATNRKG